MTTLTLHIFPAVLAEPLVSEGAIFVSKSIMVCSPNRAPGTVRSTPKTVFEANDSIDFLHTRGKSRYDLATIKISNKLDKS